MTELRLIDPEVVKCGIGLGAQCCKYLLHDAQSFLCGRETELKAILIAAEGYSAQRLPTEPYPSCQLRL